MNSQVEKLRKHFWEKWKSRIVIFFFMLLFLAIGCNYLYSSYVRVQAVKAVNLGAVMDFSVGLFVLSVSIVYFIFWRRTEGTLKERYQEILKEAETVKPSDKDEPRRDIYDNGNPVEIGS